MNIIRELNVLPTETIVLFSQLIPLFQATRCGILYACAHANLCQGFLRLSLRRSWVAEAPAGSQARHPSWFFVVMATLSPYLVISKMHEIYHFPVTPSNTQHIALPSVLYASGPCSRDTCMLILLLLVTAVSPPRP